MSLGAIASIAGGLLGGIMDRSGGGSSGTQTTQVMPAPWSAVGNGADQFWDQFVDMWFGTPEQTVTTGGGGGSMQPSVVDDPRFGQDAYIDTMHMTPEQRDIYDRYQTLLRNSQDPFMNTPTVQQELASLRQELSDSFSTPGSGTTGTSGGEATTTTQPATPSYLDRITEDINYQHGIGENLLGDLDWYNRRRIDDVNRFTGELTGDVDRYTGNLASAIDRYTGDYANTLNDTTGRYSDALDSLYGDYGNNVNAVLGDLTAGQSKYDTNMRGYTGTYTDKLNSLESQYSQPAFNVSMGGQNIGVVPKRQLALMGQLADMASSGYNAQAGAEQGILDSLNNLGGTKLGQYGNLFNAGTGVEDSKYGAGISAADKIYSSGMSGERTKYDTGMAGSKLNYGVNMGASEENTNRLIGQARDRAAFDSEYTPNKAFMTYLPQLQNMMLQLQGLRFGAPTTTETGSLDSSPSWLSTIGNSANLASNISNLINSWGK